MSPGKIFWCSLLLVPVQLKSIAQEMTNTISLQKAVETAITNNLDVRQSGLQQETAEAYLRQARAGLLPAYGTVDHTWNKGKGLDYSNSYVNWKHNCLL
jgi:outer membrane protein